MFVKKRLIKFALSIKVQIKFEKSVNKKQVDGVKNVDMPLFKLQNSSTR